MSWPLSSEANHVCRVGFHVYQETTGGHVCISNDGSAAWVCPVGYVATGSLPHCRLERHDSRSRAVVSSSPCTMYTYFMTPTDAAAKHVGSKIALANWHREWEASNNTPTRGHNV